MKKILLLVFLCSPVWADNISCGTDGAGNAIAVSDIVAKDAIGNIQISLSVGSAKYSQNLIESAILQAASDNEDSEADELCSYAMRYASDLLAQTKTTVVIQP